MAMEIWRPMREMRRMAEEMDRMMEDFFGPLPTAFRESTMMAARSFPVNVYQKNGDVVVEAALPGIRPEDVDVNVTGRTLTISAERKETREVKEEDFLRREMTMGRLWRQVMLPTEVQAGKAEATFDQGVLRLRLPQAETAKKIPIKVQGGTTGGTSRRGQT